MSNRITIRTDHGPLTLPTDCTVAQALDALTAQHPRATQEGVATAVNGQFVSRQARAQHVLHDGDALLCFAAITGG